MGIEAKCKQVLSINRHKGYLGVLGYYSCNLSVDFFLVKKKKKRIAQLVKNLPAMQETPVGFLGWEDPLEKGKATHPNTLA